MAITAQVGPRLVEPGSAKVITFAGGATPPSSPFSSP